MEYVNLGHTGVKVSRLALGMMSYGSSKWRPWVLEEAASRPFIKRALELGINFFDTADVYSLGESEVVLGRALKEFGVARDKVIVATKVCHPMGPDLNQRGLSRKHIRHALEASLRRLDMDYVDLYQIHRLDPQTPMEEILEAMNEAIDAGQTLYIGASSMYAWQFAKLQYLADHMGLRRFVTMQNHYNLVYREEEREMIPFCRAEGVGLIPWSPLARGFLAGTHRPGDFGDTNRAKTDEFGQSLYYREEDFKVVDRVTELARRKGVSNMQIALAWVLHQPGITAPIVGATKLEHLEDTVKAIELKLTPEELQFLAETYRPHPVMGHQ
jgi:aryl-alcohol dehydrogenase (NADP+)